MTESKCARCGDGIADPEDVFCSKACSVEHVEALLRELQIEQAEGPESARDRPKSSALVAPRWATAQHWFYFVDARQPDVACFGTLGDVERCILDGGWPRAVPNDEARAYDKRVDAIDSWPLKKTR